MSKFKNDLGSLLLAELLVQTSSGDLSSIHKAPADTLRLAEELDAINTMVSVGELSEEQAVIHRQLRLNALKIRLLAIEGVGDVALERVLDSMGKVMRRFYGI